MSLLELRRPGGLGEARRHQGGHGEAGHVHHRGLGEEGHVHHEGSGEVGHVHPQVVNYFGFFV